MIRGTCPVCGRTFKVDDRYAGMTGKCRTCGATVSVPGEPDEGLDGLPPIPNGAQQDDTEPAQAEAPVAVSEPQPPPPAPQPAPPTDTPHQPVEPPQPEPSPPTPQPAASPQDPVEAPLGATAVRGHWLREEPGEEPPPPEPDTPPPAEEMLGSAKLVTSIEDNDSDSRPFLLTLACATLVLVGIGFGLKFALAGGIGLAIAGVGIVLVGLAVVRMCTHHWDGMVPAFFFCLGVIGAVLLLSIAALDEGEAFRLRPDAIALLAGAGFGILVLLIALLRESVRDYLAG